MKKILTFLLLTFTISSFSQDISGQWNGFIKVQGMKLHLVFNIEKKDNGFVATMDSPDQDAKGIPVEKVSFENSNLTIEIPMAKIVYTGKLTASKKIVGTFQQAGNSFPMDLSREKVIVNRPQEPKAPFPYYSEDVTFLNPKENFSLAGTLTLPKKDGNFPVVVLISGSGAQNRNSELMGHKPFLVISDYLTKRGIGVLRIDDRGVGESQGDRTNATSKDFATDVRAAVDYLKTRKEVNQKKIGLIGHSEGGIIAPMVAANAKDIGFIILLAGSGVPGDELLLEQTYLIGKASGMIDSELEESKNSNKKVYAVMKSNASSEDKKKELSSILEKSFDKLQPSQKPSEAEMKAIIEAQVSGIVNPWMEFFIKYDPSIILKDVKCPVLVLNGGKDLQVPAKQNTEAIKNALTKAGNKKVTVATFPSMNHLFQECETGSVDEYDTIEQTFSPMALKVIADWIALQTK